MIEISRIQQDQGARVAELWDRMCRETADGGPLTDPGRTNIARMLAASAFHRDAFCLVATAGSEIVGFVNGRVDPGDGLLPGVAGEIEALYVLPERRGAGTSRRLVAAAIDLLRGQGAGTIRILVCTDDDDARRFWAGRGFEPDLVCFSLYAD